MNNECFCISSELKYLAWMQEGKLKLQGQLELRPLRGLSTEHLPLRSLVCAELILHGNIKICCGNIMGFRPQKKLRRQQIVPSAVADPSCTCFHTFCLPGAPLCFVICRTEAHRSSGGRKRHIVSKINLNQFWEILLLVFSNISLLVAGLFCCIGHLLCSPELYSNHLKAS